MKYMRNLDSAPASADHSRALPGFGRPSGHGDWSLWGVPARFASWLMFSRAFSCSSHLRGQIAVVPINGRRWKATRQLLRLLPNEGLDPPIGAFWKIGWRR